MSENYAESLARYGGLDMNDYAGALGPATGAIAPDWTGNLYAPVRYTAPGNSYARVNTNPLAYRDKKGKPAKDAAQQLSADVIRATYADYEARFQPLEDMAIGLLGERGTKDLPYDLARTRQTIGGVMGSIQGQQTRAMERFGQVDKSRSIVGSTTEAGTMVGGLNAATFADEERRMKMLGGGVGSAASAVRGG